MGTSPASSAPATAIMSAGNGQKAATKQLAHGAEAAEFPTWEVCGKNSGNWRCNAWSEPPPPGEKPEVSSQIRGHDVAPVVGSPVAARVPHGEKIAHVSATWLLERLVPCSCQSPEGGAPDVTRVRRPGQTRLLTAVNLPCSGRCPSEPSIAWAGRSAMLRYPLPARAAP